jgi:hypothetical protein
MSPASATAAPFRTTAQVGRCLGVELWVIRNLIWRGVVAPPPKLGPTFAWTPGDVERLRSALADEGYLTSPRKELP